uniref:Uncharacterized protein n=1 Tax=Lactuca sativa TaxID=4236 RepID=A0A9R1W3Z7_LACSA|nr:hypothetical protein LSAT_V11C300143940 [Lactuca sativa]
MAIFDERPVFDESYSRSGRRYPRNGDLSSNLQVYFFPGLNLRQSRAWLNTIRDGKKARTLWGNPKPDHFGSDTRNPTGKPETQWGAPIRYPKVIGAGLGIHAPPRTCPIAIPKYDLTDLNSEMDGYFQLFNSGKWWNRSKFLYLHQKWWNRPRFVYLHLSFYLNFLELFLSSISFIAYSILPFIYTSSIFCLLRFPFEGLDWLEAASSFFEDIHTLSCYMAVEKSRFCLFLNSFYAVYLMQKGLLDSSSGTIPCSELTLGFFRGFSVRFLEQKLG